MQDEKIRYIKVVMDDKRVPVLHIPYEKWTKIIADPGILIQYLPENKKEPWEAIAINKTRVIYAEYDEEYTTKANVTVHDLYVHIPTNKIHRFKRGTLPPNDFIKDFRKV